MLYTFTYFYKRHLIIYQLIGVPNELRVIAVLDCFLYDRAVRRVASSSTDVV